MLCCGQVLVLINHDVIELSGRNVLTLQAYDTEMDNLPYQHCAVSLQPTSDCAIKSRIRVQCPL